MARAADRVRGIRRHDLTGHQPVKEHPDTGQMLLDGRRGACALQLLDIGHDMNRLHVLQAANATCLAPA
jgi:hypothetical protein